MKNNMELPGETIKVAIFVHLITIIPAFLFCWEFGVGALLFWGVFDLIYYIIMNLTR